MSPFPLFDPFLFRARAGVRLRVLTLWSCLNRSGVKFQQAWRILSLVQIRMSSLQKLAQEHTLPALSLTPLPSEALPKELRDRQRAVPGVESNEGLFRMFSESMETRQNVSFVLRSVSRPHDRLLRFQCSCTDRSISFPRIAVRHCAVLGQQEWARHGPGTAVVETDCARVPQDPLTGRVAPH